MTRSYVRASERSPLQARVDFDLNDLTYTGVTRNISVGGVFVATADLPKIGDTVTLRFFLPGNPRQLSVQTEVRWIRNQDEDEPTGMGLRFVNPSAGDVAALEEYLARRDGLVGGED